MKLTLIALALLSAGCTSIDYTHRVNAPSQDVKIFYVDSPCATCYSKIHKSAAMCVVAPILACTYWPDIQSDDDYDDKRRNRAEVYLPMSEKGKPSWITEHEMAHVNGFDHPKSTTDINGGTK